MNWLVKLQLSQSNQAPALVGSNMILENLVIILAYCSVKLVVCKHVDEGLRNKHLTVIGEQWIPYLNYDWQENDSGGWEIENYRGIMMDLLMFMKRARNFTFTMVEESDEVWGVCIAENNCTGMLGMVNRGEVDLALGKFNFQYKVSNCIQANICSIFYEPGFRTDKIVTKALIVL